MSQSLHLPWDPKISNILVERSVWGILIVIDIFSLDIFVPVVIVSVTIVRVVHAVGGVERGQGDYFGLLLLLLLLFLHVRLLSTRFRSVRCRQ